MCFPCFKRKLRIFCLGSRLEFQPWQTTLLNYPVTGNSNLDCGTLAAFPTKTHGKGNKSPKNFETLRKIGFENLGRISKTRDRPQGGGSSSSRPTPGPSSPRRSRSTRRTERPEEERDSTDALHRKIALMFATVVTGSYDASATVTAFGLRQTLLHW